MLKPGYIDVKIQEVHGMRSLVQERILPDIQGFKQNKMPRVLLTLTMIVSNLFVKDALQMILEFSLDRKAYAKNKIHNPPHWYCPSYIPICFNELKRLGFIQIQKGDSCIKKDRVFHRTSRAFITPWLRGTVFQRIRFPCPEFQKDLVILRGPKRQKISVNAHTGKERYYWVQGNNLPVNRKEPFVKNNRRFLAALNKHNSQACVTGCLLNYKPQLIQTLIYSHINGRTSSDIRSPMGLYNKIVRKPVCWEFQLRDLCMFRVFNEDFEHGGRFYGSIHEELPRDVRRTIKINGQETVELDYSAMHLNMLYHREGLLYASDPYDLPGIPRDLVKEPALTMINAKDRVSAKKAIIQHLLADENHDGRTYRKTDHKRQVVELTRQIMDALEEKHSAIGDLFFSGMGLKLQKQDSEIMKSTLEKLMGMGLTCLPVHDSIICQAEVQDIVKKVMMNEYRNHMGFNPVIKAKI